MNALRNDFGDENRSAAPRVAPHVAPHLGPSSSVSARGLQRLSLLSLLLCCVVVVFGAYVRLSDAGLGCPDWPGCYGRAVVPQAPQAQARAQQAYPQRQLETPKAWKEMIHRYLAGSLGALLALMAIWAWRSKATRAVRGLTLALLGTVLVQGALGALTVLWQVNPLTVTAHLLCGLTTLSLLAALCWLGSINSATAGRAMPHPAVRALAPLLLIVVAAQIALGGWTSSNYAATACPDFPLCQGHWQPPGDWRAAFTLWHGLGVDYQYGILALPARATIHLFHRYGALLVSVCALSLCGALWRSGNGSGNGNGPDPGNDSGSDPGRWRRWAGMLLLALALQLTIGISLVLRHFPLWLGDAHNAGAALLLLCVVIVNLEVWRVRREAPAVARAGSGSVAAQTAFEGS